MNRYKLVVILPAVPNGQFPAPDGEVRTAEFMAERLEMEKFVSILNFGNFGGLRVTVEDVPQECIRCSKPAAMKHRGWPFCEEHRPIHELNFAAELPESEHFPVELK